MTEPPLKNLPIGLPSWQAIRRQDLFFLDKTSLLDALVTVQRKVLFTRPSRMGKTLLCSILKELFTHGNKNFEGIFISHTWTEPRCYPVIDLSFVTIRGDDFEQALKAALIAAFSAAGFTQAQSLEHDLPLSAFLQQFNRLASDQDLVFLIDDYDYPLTSCLNDEATFNQHLAVLRIFYAWLCHFENTRFLFLTGIMRFQDDDLIPSADVQDLSHHPDYADLLGCTTRELASQYGPYLKRAAQKLKLEPGELIAKLQQHYGGFCFDYDTQVKLYSPDSLNKFFAPLTLPMFLILEGKPVFDAYCLESSPSSEALSRYLQRHPLTEDELIALCRQDLTITPCDLAAPPDVKSITPTQLLVQNGLISPQAVSADTTDLIPRLRNFSGRITNYEAGVKYIPLVLAGMFDCAPPQARQYLQQAQKALCAGKMKDTCEPLNNLFDLLFPKVTDEYDLENLYQPLLVLGLRSPEITVREYVRYEDECLDLLLVTAEHIYALDINYNEPNQEQAEAHCAALQRALPQILQACALSADGRSLSCVTWYLCDQYPRIVDWCLLDQNGHTQYW